MATDAARNAYVVAQLKELAQVVSNFSSSANGSAFNTVTTVAPSPVAMSPMYNSVRGVFPPATPVAPEKVASPPVSTVPLAKSGLKRKKDSEGFGPCVSTSPAVKRIVAAPTGVENEAQSSPPLTSISNFVVSRLEQLSQLLNMPGAPVIFSVADSTTAEAGARKGARAGAKAKFGARATGNSSSVPSLSSSGLDSSSEESLHYSASEASCASKSSSSSFSPFSARSSGASWIAPATPKPGSGRGVTDRTTVRALRQQAPSLAAPAFESGGLINPGLQRVPSGGKKNLFSPIYGSNGSGRGGSSNTDRPGIGWTPAKAISENDVEDGKSEDSEEPEMVRVESTTTTRTSQHSILFQAFGRASLWRQMLGAESRATSALVNIVAENAVVLDQGIILPCSPSDEEKVGCVRRGLFLFVYSTVV